MVTLNKVGIGLPAGLEKAWESKLRSSRQSDAQLESNIRLMDPADRVNIRTYVRAITNVPGDASQEGGAAASSKETSKRRRK